MPAAAEMFEVVRRAYAAFNRGDADAFRELSSADVEIHDLATMPSTESFSGWAGIERFLADNWGTWEAVWGEIEQLLEAGPDRILVLARHGARARGGPEVVQSRGVLVTFSEADKIKEIRFFADPGEAFAAAGLSKHSAA